MDILLEYSPEDIKKLFLPSFRKLGYDEKDLMDLERTLRVNIFLQNEIPKAFIMIRLIKLVRDHFLKDAPPGKSLEEILNNPKIQDVYIGIRIFYLFDKEKSRLEKVLTDEERELLLINFNKFNNFNDLWNWCRQISLFVNLEDIRERKESPSAKIASALIWENDHVKIYEISSYEVMCQLGYGSTWCTTQTSFYEKYMEFGSLYVIIPKKKQQYRNEFGHIVEKKYLLYLLDYGTLRKIKTTLTGYFYDFSKLYKNEVDNLVSKLAHLHSYLENHSEILDLAKSNVSRKYLNNFIKEFTDYLNRNHEEVNSYIESCLTRPNSFYSCLAMNLLNNLNFNSKSGRIFFDFFTVYRANEKLIRSLLDSDLDFSRLIELSDRSYREMENIWIRMQEELIDELNAPELYQLKDETQKVEGIETVISQIQDWDVFQNYLKHLKEMFDMSPDAYADIVRSFNGLQTYLEMEWLPDDSDFNYYVKSKEIAGFLRAVELQIDLDDLPRNMILYFDRKIFELYGRKTNSFIINIPNTLANELKPLLDNSYQHFQDLPPEAQKILDSIKHTK